MGKKNGALRSAVMSHKQFLTADLLCAPLSSNSSSSPRFSCFCTPLSLVLHPLVFYLYVIAQWEGKKKQPRAELNELGKKLMVVLPELQVSVTQLAPLLNLLCFL